MTEMSIAQEQQPAKRAIDLLTTQKTKAEQEIIGEPGILQYLPVYQLMIDQEYQRTADQKHVNRIANNWDWRKVKCINVAMRPDTPSLYAVYDGQHIVLAARKRNIMTLPCYIIHAEHLRDEASGFVGINRDRKVVNMAKQFNAMVIAEDPRAKRLIALINKHGFFVSDGKTTKDRYTQAIGTMLTALDQGMDLDKTLKMISEVWQGKQPSLHSSFISGLLSFLYRVGDKVSQDDIVKSLSRHSASEIQHRAILLGKAKSIHGSTASTEIWREVFLDCYNHGKHKHNRLSFDVV